MRSMTGFGFQRLALESGALEVSVRTVNARFLETRFHLPREYMPLESELRTLLGQSLRRGTVDVFVHKKTRGVGGASKVVVNQDLAKAYAQSAKALAKSLKVTTGLTLEALMSAPGVVTLDDTPTDAKKEEKLFLKAFAQALESCVKEREREGQALQKDLEGLIKKLEKNLKDIAAHRAHANELLQSKMEARLKERLQGFEVDVQRVAQEVAIQMDKADINEEIQRLTEHLSHFHGSLKKGDVEGKKLDFYTQELLREFNTIGSKSQVAGLTQIVVESKTLIERLREQVQNVE